MRLDHIAYRTADRVKTAQFFIDALGYRIQTEFKLEFDDGSTTDCIALEPPEKPTNEFGSLCIPWTWPLKPKRTKRDEPSARRGSSRRVGQVHSGRC